MPKQKQVKAHDADQQQVVDTREVLPQAEYHKRISKLNTMAEIRSFRCKFRREA